MAISLKYGLLNFRLFAITLVVLFIVIQGASAQEAPTAEQLKVNLELELPAYWAVDNMAIEASANYGNAVEPVFKQRIVVTISPKVDLFLPIKQLGTTVLIEPTIKAQVPQKLFAISSSKLRAAKWITEFERETDPTKGMGQPRTAFGALTILQNSPEEAAYWATQNADQNRQQQDQLAKIARETEIRQAELTQQEALNVAKIKQQQAQKATRDAAQAALIKSAAENVRRIITAKIPTYWKVEKLTLADATGDPTIIRFNYKANLLLMEDLFVVDAEQGSTKFLIPALSQGAKIIQTGATTSKNGPDGWIVTARPDNPATKYDGLPISMYTRPTIVRGTEQETAYYAARAALAERENAAKLAEIERQKAIATAQATAEAALQAEAADRVKQAKLAQIARQKEIDLAKAQAAKEAIQSQATKQASAEQRRTAAAAKTKQELDALQTSLASKSNSVRMAVLQAALDSPNQAVNIVARQAIWDNKNNDDYHFLLVNMIGKIRKLSARYVNPSNSSGSDVDYPFTLLVIDFDPVTNRFSANLRGPGGITELGRVDGQIVGNAITFSNQKMSATYSCSVQDNKWSCGGNMVAPVQSAHGYGGDMGGVTAQLWLTVFGL